MTKQRRDNHSTQFGLWLRKQEHISSLNFDAQNLDYIWFAYRYGWLILIEEKRYGKSPEFAQKDTHSVVSQMLKFSSGNIFNTAKGERKIEYKGYFLIQFEKTNPEDSKWIKINGSIHSKADLLFLLKYGELVNHKKLGIEYGDLPPPIIISRWKSLKEK